MTRRTNRLTSKQGTSPLVQFWATPRLREALRLVADRLVLSQSAIVRAALWKELQRHLSRRDISRLDEYDNTNRKEKAKVNL